MQTDGWVKGLMRTVIMMALWATASGAWAQSLAQHNWYFGNSVRALRFDRGNNAPTVIQNQALPFGTAGAAVATDITNANVMFYSDGTRVYDKTHQLMPGTGGLLGNSNGNQPAAVCPIPGQPNKYFLFSNSANFTTGGTVRRLVIDMTAFGNAAFPSPPTGAGEGSVAPVPLLTNRSEGMIVVGHANGTDFWLITHETGTRNYAATLIEAASYTGTFNTTLSTGVGVPISVAHFAYHEPSGRLVVAPLNANTDALILTFDNTTGAINLDQPIINSAHAAVASPAVYDVEWSRNGRFVYLSRHGEGAVSGQVFQFDTQNPTVTLAPLLSPAPFRSYGLQLAPDSSLYHLYQDVNGGPFRVGRFTGTDTVSVGVRYEPLPFGTLDFNGRQFPSFLPRFDIPLTVSFTTAGTCQNTPISFYPTVTPTADSLAWAFGDGQTSNAWSPVHTYNNPGTFNVSLTAFFQGVPTTVSQNVNIQGFQLRIQLVQDTTACRSEFPPPRGTATAANQFRVTAQVSGGSPASAVWSNGNTGLTLRPDSAGYYVLVVTDGAGCSTYAGVNVKEYGLQDSRFNVWYFGDRAGIDFNTQPPTAIPAGARTLNAPEGVSIVCDRNGDVIFYTDGDRVFDEDDVEVDNGIGGEANATQSALIVQVPGDETLYYIFTTQAVNGSSAYELRYSLFDQKQRAGKGDIVEKAVLLFSRSTERVTSNGQWVIAHEYGNNIFRAYRISPQGIGAPVFSSLGSDHSFGNVANGEGYMKLGPRNNLAVALSTPGTSNRIELFHFNDNTGRVENFRPIVLPEPNGQVYGLEFSGAGNKLFATVTGPPSALFEYFLDSIDQPYFRNRINNAGRLGALQRGPDGQIYMAIDNSGVLGTIVAIEDTLQVSTVNFSGFTLAGGTQSRLGLPNFVQISGNASGGPALEIAGFCLGNPTEYFVTPTDAIDTWILFFGDGGSDANNTEVQHTYAAAGNYSVNLVMTNRCIAKGDNPPIPDVTELIRINPSPATPTIPAAAALCTGALTLDANTGNTPNLTHVWTTGETTRAIVVNAQGSYGVTTTDANGCTATGVSIVVENRPVVDLGPDLTLCEDTPTPALDAQNPGNTIQWRIVETNSLLGTASVQAVDTSNPGLFTYEVTVTDPVTGCVTVEAKTFTINVSPNFVFSGTNPTGCGAPDGSITLVINPSTPTGGPYSYFITGPGGFSQQAFDVVVPPANTIGPVGGRPAGTYTAIVQDQVSACTLSNFIGLTDAAFTATAAVQGANCEPVVLRVTITGGVAPYSATFFNNTDGSQYGPVNSATPTLDSPGLTAGNYLIAVRDNTGCIFNINQAVLPDPRVPVTITPDLCALPNPTLTALGGAPSFSWTGPGIVGNPNVAQIQINASGTYTVTTGAGPGQCPGVASVVVTVPTPIAPDFTQSDPCADVVILTATPAGPNLTYRWYLNGTGAPVALGGQISLGVSAAGSYQVEVVNAVTGCAVRSSIKPVSIVGAITATLAATQACDNDQPFTLTVTTNAVGATFAWFRNNVLIPTATGASINQTEAGTYRVEITRLTCTTPATLNIVKAPAPQGQLPNRVVICNDPDNNDPATSQVDLDPGPFVTYNWFKNQVTLNFTNRVFTATSEGLYEVDITNNFNCTSRDRTEVLNDCVPKVVAPNAFRPSSAQAANRDFYVFSFFITDDFQILIYNRWGELVFESKDRNFKWNGGYRNNPGQPMPGGTYAYVVRYVSSFRPERGVQEQRGGVVLLR